MQANIIDLLHNLQQKFEVDLQKKDLWSKQYQ